MSETESRFWRWWEENWFWMLLFGSPAVAGFFTFLAKWPAAEVIVLTAILLAAVIVMVGLVFWRQVRLRQADAAFKQALLQRELSVADIERLVTCQPAEPTPTEAESLAKLTGCLHASEVPENIIEQVFAAIRRADPSLRQSIGSALCGLGGDAGDEATEAEILAVLRGLCPANETAPGASAPLADRIDSVFA